VQQQGLVAALQSHIANLARDGLPVNLNATAYKRQPPEQEEALYRIAQEALNNVVKHAGAQQVELILAVDGHTTQLKIIDDGVGFEPALSLSPASPPPLAEKSGSGLGLMTMRERAEGLNGKIQVTAVPGKGTTVTVTIPSKN
jgi:signal transduction histidine kinase